MEAVPPAAAPGPGAAKNGPRDSAAGRGERTYGRHLRLTCLHNHGRIQSIVVDSRPASWLFRASQGPTALGRGEFPLVAVIRWESNRCGLDVVSDHANPSGLLEDKVLVVLLGAIE